MNYFDKTNEALRPYAEYDGYVLYCIDTRNKNAGIELYFDECKTFKDAAELIDKALGKAFDEMNLNKIYVNVIRDNFLYTLLSKFNFISEAIHRGQYCDETAHDVVYMTVLRHEWRLGGVKLNYSYDLYDVVESEKILEF